MRVAHSIAIAATKRRNSLGFFNGSGPWSRICPSGLRTCRICTMQKSRCALSGWVLLALLQITLSSPSGLFMARYQSQFDRTWSHFRRFCSWELPVMDYRMIRLWILCIHIKLNFKNTKFVEWYLDAASVQWCMCRGTNGYHLSCLLSVGDFHRTIHCQLCGGALNGVCSASFLFLDAQHCNFSSAILYPKPSTKVCWAILEQMGFDTSSTGAQSWTAENDCYCTWFSGYGSLVLRVRDIIPVLLLLAWSDRHVAC